MKEIDKRLLKALIKNPRRSDRELAIELGISQPTVSRRRVVLEKTVIQNYAAIPDLAKIGINIIAFTFTKNPVGEVKSSLPDNVILTVLGQGLGYKKLYVSMHKDYADFMAFHKLIDREEVETFLVDTNSGIVKSLCLENLL